MFPDINKREREKKKHNKKLTEDVETGEEEGDFEEAVTKESKDEAGGNQDNGNNGSRDSDLCDTYSYCKRTRRGKDIVSFNGLCIVNMILWKRG